MTEIVTIGAAQELKRTFRQEDFDRFAALSGDDNPIHVDKDYAATTRFGRTIGHGMLAFTVLSTLVDEMMPGSELLEQELEFLSPTFADEEMTFRAVVTEFGGGIARVESTMARADGSLACRATTLLQII